jgi:integrase
MTQALEKGVRQSKTGGYELTITHQLLPGGRVSRSFLDAVEAGEYKGKMLRVLNLGVVPAELTRSYARVAPRTSPPVRQSKSSPTAASKKGTTSPALNFVLVAYLRADTAKIAKSDIGSVETLSRELQGTLDGVKTLWVDDWVRSMKRVDKLAPGTIRKKVETLARCIDWWNRQEHQAGTAPPNVLRLLPVGYSNYCQADMQDGEPVITDEKRDRRLHLGEYEEIESVLQGKKRSDRQRKWASNDAADFLMLFRILVHTGLRLREAYRLRVGDVKLPLRTLHIAKSKTGAKRDVPMSRQLAEWVREYIGERTEGPVFTAFWNGSEQEAVLGKITRLLSRRFSSLFDHCGCVGLTEHDLRHEATCRWVEMLDKEGRPLFRAEEVMRITGHKNHQMFIRYLSLRGSDLADRMD